MVMRAILQAPDASIWENLFYWHETQMSFALKIAVRLAYVNEIHSPMEYHCLRRTEAGSAFWDSFCNCAQSLTREVCCLL